MAHASAIEFPPIALPGRTIHLETFGCQMNELDSELVRSQLGALGYRFTDESTSADVVLYNTCSVREQAENKVYSRIGLMGLERAGGRRVIIGVLGCMAEREGVAMMRRFPQIDLMCGPGELDRLPLLVDNAMKAAAVEAADLEAARVDGARRRPARRSRSEVVALQGNTSRRSTTLAAAQDNLEMLDLSRAFDPDRAAAGGRSAYVRITRGCNKFCTYCVVPYTRGAEVHRPPDSIVDECRRLADQGVIEVTLLGQTVNHYLYTHGVAVSAGGLELPQVGPGASAFAKPGPYRHGAGTAKRADRSHAVGARRVTTFAELLRRIHDEVPAIRRLRFVTSYARDFGDDILEVMAASPRICRYIHAPAQSGSDRILKRMNRGYTVSQYLDFIDRARAALPDACIGGDIIVGFPGETDEDFQQTASLLERVRFKNNFIFKYSPRPGTAAMERFADDVPEAAKRRRNQELLALQSRISAEVHAAYVGGVVEVFVEKVTDRMSSRGASGGVASGSAGAVTAVSIGGRELRGSGAAPIAQRERVQLCGRTGGDLIAVFEVDDERRAQALVGEIAPVRVAASGPLLLMGALANQAFGSASARGWNHPQPKSASEQVSARF